MVSSDYFNRHDEWWFDTEEAARKKRAELLATLDTMRKDDLYDDESFLNTFASFLNEAINTME